MRPYTDRECEACGVALILRASLDAASPRLCVACRLHRDALRATTRRSLVIASLYAAAIAVFLFLGLLAAAGVLGW